MVASKTPLPAVPRRQEMVSRKQEIEVKKRGRPSLPATEEGRPLVERGCYFLRTLPPEEPLELPEEPREPPEEPRDDEPRDAEPPLREDEPRETLPDRPEEPRDAVPDLPAEDEPIRPPLEPVERPDEGLA